MAEDQPAGRSDQITASAAAAKCWLPARSRPLLPLPRVALGEEGAGVACLLHQRLHAALQLQKVARQLLRIVLQGGFLKTEFLGVCVCEDIRE